MTKLRVTGDEDATLKLRTYVDGKPVGQAIFRLDVPAGSEVTLGFAAGQDPSVLR